jgi:hypothetical protein
MKYAALILAVLLSAPMTFSAPEVAFAGNAKFSGGAKKVCRWETITRRVWRNGRPHNVTYRVKRCFDHHHH